mmetsp:Transcript_18669/g.21038  ORF Transcript_18669/g.21038 Transcript_18669/m.21038 type:complete len:97 (+) Transcript_18669:26-316(+)
MSKRNRENDASKKRKKKKSKKITKAKVELEIKKEDGNVVDSQKINPDSSNVVKKQPSKKEEIIDTLRRRQTDILSQTSKTFYLFAPVVPSGLQTIS